MIRTDLASRLQEGRRIARKKHKEENEKKLGNLRAGNSGIMSEDGDIAGACARIAHLRALGIEVEEPDDSRVIMFQMGTANEDVVYNDLVKTKAEDEVILREEEIPIEWMTKNGTKVTGRPDMVVCRLDTETTLPSGAANVLNTPVPRPLYGIEIKGVFSVWTSRDVLFDASPKMANLIQAAHYSWKLGVPFRLLYKQYANQAVPSWANKFFPKKGEKHSEHIEYNDKGEVKNINPFEIVYELEWDKDYLKYRREGDARWTKTMIRSADIERFYEHAAGMAVSKELGKRPLTIDAKGKEKSFSNCGYCPLKPICDSTEKNGYGPWLAEVQRFVRNK